jgi:hypothetical protein
MTKRDELAKKIMDHCMGKIELCPQLFPSRIAEELSIDLEQTREVMDLMHALGILYNPVEVNREIGYRIHPSYKQGDVYRNKI